MIKQVLPSGVKLFLIDDVAPLDAAMLTMLYARLPESVEVQVGKVYEERRRALTLAIHQVTRAEDVNVSSAAVDHAVQAAMQVWSDNHPTVRAGRLTDKWVSGYGHRSIADNGYAALFVEGGSMLLAKALQDTPLYNGQEMSSRAVDCGIQHYCDPLGTDASRAVLEGWRALYRRVLAAAHEETRCRHPKGNDEDQKTYESALKMRAFDIARGILPFGCSTNVGWSGTLRHLGDRLAFLVHHPDAGVQEVARGLLAMCAARYPDSGFDGAGAVSGVGLSNERQVARYARDAWTHAVMRDLAYMPEDDGGLREDGVGSFDSIMGGLTWAHPLVRARLADRPRGALVPHTLLSLGMARFEFPLDMGSWRDLQRQRAMVVEPALLTTRYGFEPWYLEQLPGGNRSKYRDEITGRTWVGDWDGFAEEVMLAVSDLARRAEALTDDPVVRQHYLPLGYRVRTRVSSGLPGLIYFLELRTGKTIHPTLRRRTLDLARVFRKLLPDVALHVDEDPDDWSVRRGTQTIERKEQS